MKTQVVRHSTGLSDGRFFALCMVLWAIAFPPSLALVLIVNPFAALALL